jgi:DNA-directed RNA polymerase subunit RPC12/RpoP
MYLFVYGAEPRELYRARMTQATLAVLACASCGAHVAVSREKTTHCDHCGHDTEVPETYRAALDNAQREVEADALTQTAFATLGTEPAWPLRAIGVISSSWWAIPILFLVVFDIVIDLVDSLFDHIRPWFGVNAWDWFTTPERSILVWGSAIFMMTMLVVLGAFGLRRATDVSKLQAALAAKPPAREGGASCCRECGAPLTIPKNALGVRCVYCKTDNLVALSKVDVARARGATKEVAREAKDALSDHRGETRKLRIRLAVRLAVIAVLASWILSSPIRNESTEKTGDFALRYALKHPRELFDQKITYTEFGNAPHPPSPKVPVDRCASTWGINREDMFCKDDACYGGWFVALAKGETLTLTFDHPAATSLYAHNDDRGWIAAYGDFTDWGSEVAKANGAAGQLLSTKAKYTSWYRIQFAIAGVAERMNVCAQIEEPTK